ncbi:hypothetical protein [Burkholderia sp. LMU1-1-1.1]|uniref:hypothetical protein n=1 Tax=Burkholderia sp. LMU1-1-1.1 TaxID=3135266 RepID=UPI003423B868
MLTTKANTVDVLSKKTHWTTPQYAGMFILFASVAFVVLLPHWGLTVEDSLAYFNTARYLRGEVAFSDLRAPFPYRVLIPALAAYMPGDLRDTFAGINWMSITIAAAAMALVVDRVGGSRKQAVFAGLLLIVSVPTFWYGSYLLTDPGAICGRALFVLGVVTGQPWLALGAGLGATAVREENILLILWLLVNRRVSIFPGLAVLGAAIGWLLFVRWHLFSGLPRYVWLPSLDTVWTALHDVRAMLSVASAAVIVVPLAAFGMRHSPVRLTPLKSILVLMALPPLYAALSVRIDGRAIWSLYPFLIPFAVYAISPRASAASSNNC